MKKVIGCIIAACLALVMAIGMVGCGMTVDPETYAFVTIDINPSLELVTRGGNVVDVKAANYDACVLLEGEDFTSLTLEEATEQIVALAEELGYLTDSNNQVKITVAADDAQTVEILKSAAKSGAEKGSKKAETNTSPRLQDELTLKKLKAEKPGKFDALTVEKVRLIESVMEHDSSVTYETGADMTVNELAAALESALAADQAVFTPDLRAEFSASYAAAKQEIEREIAAIHGEEYLAVWESYTSVSNVYNSILTELEQAGVSEEDAATLCGLLGISDVSLIEKGGIVKPEYVMNYVDKHINKKGSAVSQTAVDAALELLDEYDPANHVLTQEEKELFAQALGEETDFTVLSDADGILSERKAALDSLKRTITLTAEQVEQVKVLKESFASVRESVLEGMRDSIAAARSEIAAEKQSRVR